MAQSNAVPTRTSRIGSHAKRGMTSSVLRTGLLVLLVIAPGAPAQQAEPAPPMPAPAVVIHAGHVLANPGEPVEGAHTVVVREGKIISVEAGFQTPGQGETWNSVKPAGEAPVCPWSNVTLTLAVLDAGTG